MTRNIAISLFLLFVLTGCGVDFLGILNSGGGNPKPYTIYDRTPGVGTIKQEIYEVSNQEQSFKKWNIELIDMLDANISAPLQLAEIIPLTVGNRWIYVLESFDESGTSLGIFDDTTTVDRDSLLNGETYYILKRRGLPFQLAINREDGYYVRIASLDTLANIIALDEEYLAAKFPTKKGDKFPNEAGAESEVLSTKNSISVPFGVFKTIKYIKRFID